jgi:thiamine biosynthesis lipoprotein
MRLLKAGRPAMGTVFEVLFPSRERPLIELTHRALDEIRRLEKMMTVFDETSQLCRVNREAVSNPVPVDSELLEILRISLNLSQETQGAFDVTTGALWRCWGFHEKTGRLPSEKEIDEARTRTGWKHVSLDAEGGSVQICRAGVELNLGSIGKGFALDRAAGMLQNAGFGTALLHAGRSSFYALGSPAESGAGWKLSIRHPLDKESDLLTLRLNNLGMGTSGVGEQYFEVEGRRFGHVVDPRTGWPVQHNLSATAVAPSATIADALSTTFFVMNENEVNLYCQKNPGIGAIVVPRPRDGQELRVFCHGTAGRFIEDGLSYSEVDS